jgi:hypothetical protein
MLNSNIFILLNRLHCRLHRVAKMEGWCDGAIPVDPRNQFNENDFDFVLVERLQLRMIMTLL